MLSAWIAGCLASSLLGDAAFADTGDGAILKQLRPEQRQYVIIASRDGAPRVISYAPATPRRAIAAAPPPPKPAKVALRPAPAPHIVALRDERPFVPTVTVDKPVAVASPPAEAHDLAWVYAHRFDTPPPDSIRIPGDLVRSQIGSPFDIKSGAFHGVRAVNGWSAVRAQVSIPCGVGHFSTGLGFNEVTRRIGMVDQETGYINIGGWGAGTGGAAADAGLQKSSAQGARDDYAFYWKYARNKPITLGLRFPCGGPDVVLELYPVSDRLLVFSATGRIDRGRRITLTIVQQTRPEDGWIPSGGSRNDGIILKRIVAIAQPSLWRRSLMSLLGWNRFGDGSYFGVRGPGDTTPRIVWRDCELGRVVPPAIVPRYHAWTDSDTWTASAPGIYTDWPPADIVKGASGACDAAGIYLRGA